MEALVVAIESAKSLHVRGMRDPLDGGDRRQITQGTAFVVRHNEMWFLLTNLHIVTGRDPVTNVPSGSAALPSVLTVWHNTAEGLGYWAQVSYRLYDEQGRASWYEHPRDPNWDVVALQIEPQPELSFYPYEFTAEDQHLVTGPGSDLSIIGFPFGTSSDGRFAIWNRATVASDPDLDYDKRPTFLVDSRSRPGQSGSPVILKPNGISMYSNGSIVANGHAPIELMGIYSGRISPESDLGIVWKTRIVQEIVSLQRRSQRTYED